MKKCKAYFCKEDVYNDHFNTKFCKKHHLHSENFGKTERTVYQVENTRKKPHTPTENIKNWYKPNKTVKPKKDKRNFELINKPVKPNKKEYKRKYRGKSQVIPRNIVLGDITKEEWKRMTIRTESRMKELNPYDENA